MFVVYDVRQIHIFVVPLVQFSNSNKLERVAISKFHGRKYVHCEQGRVARTFGTDGGNEAINT